MGYIQLAIITFDPFAPLVDVQIPLDMLSLLFYYTHCDCRYTMSIGGEYLIIPCGNLVMLYMPLDTLCVLYTQTDCHYPMSRWMTTSN